MADLSCQECQDLLPLVADGALDAESDPVLFAHLAACAQCQEALAAHDLITVALGEAPVPKPRLSVVHYRISRMWSAAAAAMVMAALTVTWTLARPAAPTDAVALQEVIHVIDPGHDGQARSVLLIRQGDRSTLVEAETLDQLRGETGTAEPNARPVRMRY